MIVGASKPDDLAFGKNKLQWSRLDDFFFLVSAFRNTDIMGAYFCHIYIIGCTNLVINEIDANENELLPLLHTPYIFMHGRCE